jgi:hypothetical protein
MANVFRGDGVSREIDEELESHVAEAIEQGRDPIEARRAFGSALRNREASRDVRLVAWLESLRDDAVFGWRQLMKKKVTSAAAILSLALAIGACTSAFRLIDALLLRPLPVAEPERLYALCREGVDLDGQVRRGYDWAYPSFRLMRAAVKGQAELLAVSKAERQDLTYRSDQEMEKPYLQYVSGWMFDSFGLRPAVGRLFTENDDLKPGAHPYAVISYDYWTRRFARDPVVVGRTFRMGDRLYEIVGVGPAPFTGTETGTVTDIFVPTMMHPGVTKSDWTWMGALARLKPGAAVEPVRQKLHATSRAFEEERAKGFSGMSKQDIDKFLDLKLQLEPAAAGASGLQQNYRPSLVALGLLVGLVLLYRLLATPLRPEPRTSFDDGPIRSNFGLGRRDPRAGQGTWFARRWSAPFVVSRINPRIIPRDCHFRWTARDCVRWR